MAKGTTKENDFGWGSSPDNKGQSAGQVPTRIMTSYDELAS